MSCLLSQSQSEKLSFLNAVGILSSLVRDQANGNMNEYYPKALLAKKIEVRKGMSLNWSIGLEGDSPKPRGWYPSLR